MDTYQRETPYLTQLNPYLSRSNAQDDRALSLNQDQSIVADNVKAFEHNGTSTPRPESHIESYTIALICALQEEFQAACQMLDVDDFEAPQGMEKCMNDGSVYVFGRLGSHYVIVGCLPRGRLGPVNAANVAKDMTRSFPSLKFALMVGIGGGAPTRKQDIRLGDVVVSVPSGERGGVVQLDFGTRLPNGIFLRKGQLNSPPDALLSATQEIQRLLDDPRKSDRIAEHISRMDHMPAYQRPLFDRLYRSDYIHRDIRDTKANMNNQHDEDHSDEEDEEDDETEDGCRYCEDDGLVQRKNRQSDRKVIVHYGTIASDSVVMRDAKTRDKHAKNKDLNVLCFEMEAAGLMNNLPCLVIRGVCDYSDTHKNDEWQKYAALTAAAYARELLLVLRPQIVVNMPSWAGECE
ncbi:purine and uridine phosphorylase [Xylaria scruposa]|nr:purine and uridine phosphorylase [Xylaria scruposa]